MKIGEKIKSTIEGSGLSISEVARRIGTSYQNLNKIFKKDSIESKYLEKIANVLNIPIDVFFNKEYIKPDKTELLQTHAELNQIKGMILAILDKNQNIEECFPEFLKIVDNVNNEMLKYSKS